MLDAVFNRVIEKGLGIAPRYGLNPFMNWRFCTDNGSLSSSNATLYPRPSTLSHISPVAMREYTKLATNRVVYPSDFIDFLFVGRAPAPWSLYVHHSGRCRRSTGRAVHVCRIKRRRKNTENSCDIRLFLDALFDFNRRYSLSLHRLHGKHAQEVMLHHDHLKLSPMANSCIV